MKMKMKMEMEMEMVRKKNGYILERCFGVMWVFLWGYYIFMVLGWGG